MAVSESTKKINIDHKKCAGCQICVQVCALHHEHEFNPRRARIKIVMKEVDHINAPLLCRQCKKCIDACKRLAITWDEKLGAVRVDASKCNGCGLCMEVCEEEAIFLDPISKKVNICDLCNGDPQCVKWCPFEVLRYESV